MSPRAAWRLESMGFADVYDYVAGKVDWLANGLPREGMTEEVPYAGDLVHGDVVTCGLDERLASVVERVERSAHRFALVLNEERVLLGRIPADELERPGDRTAAEAIEPGPATIRPNQPAEPLGARMAEGGLHTMIVTTPQGRLLGILRREDAERGVHPRRHGR